MKDQKGARTESSKEPGPFKPAGVSRGDESSNRVNFRQQSLVANQQSVRQMLVSRPAVKPTFRTILGQ